MQILTTFLDFIVQTLLAEFIVVVFGVLFAQFMQERWEQWRYGGWHVIIRQEGDERLRRSISPGKAKDVLHEPAELSVFLKGTASPYAWITCDLLEKGKEIGLLVQDPASRQFVIDLDNNPPPPIAPPGTHVGK